MNNRRSLHLLAEAYKQVVEKQVQAQLKEGPLLQKIGNSNIYRKLTGQPSQEQERQEQDADDAARAERLAALAADEETDKKSENYLKSGNGIVQTYIENGSKGNLNLRGTDIQQLPDNLIVNGNLDLSGTAIKELPDDLLVKGDLYIQNTAIKKLPDWYFSNKVHVAHALHVMGTPMIEDEEYMKHAFFAMQNRGNIKHVVWDR